MLNGLAGYLSGFDGDFGFDAIGDKYAEHNVSRLAPFRLATILKLNLGIVRVRKGALCPYATICRADGFLDYPGDIHDHEGIRLPCPDRSVQRLFGSIR